MNPETLKALQESIAHHERLRDGVEGERTGLNQCSLCKLFNNFTHSFDSMCKSCPVYQKTRRVGCNGTPYEKVFDLSFNVKYELGSEALNKYGQEWTDACQAEINFLKSLLP